MVMHRCTPAATLPTSPLVPPPTTSSQPSHGVASLLHLPLASHVSPSPLHHLLYTISPSPSPLHHLLLLEQASLLRCVSTPTLVYAYMSRGRCRPASHLHSLPPPVRRDLGPAPSLALGLGGRPSPSGVARREAMCVIQRGGGWLQALFFAEAVWAVAPAGDG